VHADVCARVCVRARACVCARACERARVCARVFEIGSLLRFACAFLMELIYSRCLKCVQKMHQCRGCFSNDQTAKKEVRAAKKLKLSGAPAMVLDFAAPSVALPPASVAVAPLSPLVAVAPLSPLVAVAPLSPFQSPFAGDFPFEHSFPEMGDPAPLAMNGQVLWPMPATPQNAAKASQAAKSRVLADSDSDSSDSSSSSETHDKEVKTDKAKKMPRISKDERACVCDWITKWRKDGKVCNRFSNPSPIRHLIYYKP
jgi:hypothetical protein